MHGFTPQKYFRKPRPRHYHHKVETAPQCSSQCVLFLCSFVFGRKHWRANSTLRSVALNGKRHFTISGTLLKHSGPSPQSGPCTLYDFCWAHVLVTLWFFVGRMYWFLQWIWEKHKVAIRSKVHFTIFCFANVLVFTMSLRKIIKWPCPLYDVFFAYCVGFYNGLKKNHKVAMRFKETILCFFLSKNSTLRFFSNPL